MATTTSKAAEMLGPKTDNQITGGEGNAQVGHNSGTINVGLTFAEHKQELKDRLAAKTADLERAHDAERRVLASQISVLTEKLNNLDVDYQERLAELADVKRRLAKYDNQLDADKRDAAFAAIDHGDTTLAQALFKELVAKAAARREDAASEEAGLEFELGKLAEAEVRWADAAKHYVRSATLFETVDNLYKATHFSKLSGDYKTALRFADDMVIKSRAENDRENLSRALDRQATALQDLGEYGRAEPLFREALDLDEALSGNQSSTYAIRLNNLALVIKEQGRYAEAEDLYRQALEIDRATIGEGHRDYAVHLNNLASVIEAQGRYAEAEEVYRQALEIDRVTIGEGHPDYAAHLNNLAGVIKAQGRYAEAEEVYRQALEINRATIGEGHPVYAIHLNNLALVIEAQGRYAEAEELYRQALEVTATTVGVEHPSYAIRLVNLGSLLGQTGKAEEGLEMLEQALVIFQKTLPADHPYIEGTLGHIENLSRTK